MASITLQGGAERWGAGTTVGAYRESNWLQSELPESGAPKGSSDTTAAVQTDGSVTFTGLADGTKYVAVQPSGGTYNYEHFSTPPPLPSLGSVTVSGSEAVTIADGDDSSQGAKADPESASGSGSVIAILKRLRTLLNGGLPAALGSSGGLKVESVADSSAKAEDSAAASGDLGFPVLVVRNDNDAVLTSADGDYSMLAVDSSGRIKLVSSGVPGSAVPGRALQVGGSDGTNLRPLLVDSGGRLAPTTTTTPTVTQTAASASNVANLFALNANAKARKLYNDSTAVLYLKFGATASTSSYTVQVPPQGYYEFPTPLYTGRVDGIWSAAAGNALLTEET